MHVWDVGKWHFIGDTVLAKVGHIEQLDHTSLIYDRINPTLKNDNWSKGAPKYFMLLTTPWTGLWLHTVAPLYPKVVLEVICYQL